MRSARALGFSVAFVLVYGGCDSGRSGGVIDAGSADARVDDGAVTADTGVALDAGTLDAGRDAGVAVDAAGPAVDAGPPCGGPCDVGKTCCPSGVIWSCVTLPAGTECPMPDLTIDPARVHSDMSFGWEFFPDADCSVLDNCVRAPGWRRLMRFSTQTPNIGTGDAVFGRPEAGNPAFDYNACVDQYRFETYAQYHLRDSGGTEVATGYKRAFCLMDTNRYDTTTPGVSPTPVYGCSNQGIARGWSDVYSAGLDCQYVDVTDITPGDYTLRVSLNTAHRLIESSYDNDDVDVPITIPADMSRDPLLACTGTPTGVSRDCGWMVAGTFTCTAGAMVHASCGAGCAASACTGDPVMRVCDGASACTGREAIGSDDDCMASVYCPSAAFTCPASGRVTVMTAPYRTGDMFTCTAGVM